MRPITPLRLALAASAILLALSPVRGEDFPDQPVRVIVPTQAGGMADILSRVFAQKVKEQSGATVIVENKTGANGVLAADYVAKSRAERLDRADRLPGYPGGAAASRSQAAVQAADRFRSGGAGRLGALRAGGAPSFPAKTVKEFVEIVKQKPGGYSYASRASAPRIIWRRSCSSRGRGRTRRRHLSRRGARQPGCHRRPHSDRVRQPRQRDEQHPRRQRPGAGDHRHERAPQIAEVPTMAEAGVPNVVVSSWFALFVPAGTPKDAIAWLNKQANEAFSAPEVREQFARQGVTFRSAPPRRSAPMSPPNTRSGATWSVRPTSRCRK